MKKNHFQKGQIVIIAFLTLGVLLLLASYFLNFTLTESKISQSYKTGVNTYYLAEAGINEAIWKLKNDDTVLDGDPAWQSDFVDPAKNPYPDGTYWSASFSKSDVLGGSYSVTIENTSQARGKITVAATTTFGNNKVSQRIVKTTVFKGLASPIQNSAIFTGGPSENIDINSTLLNIFDGNLFCNNNLNINGFSAVKAYDNLSTSDLEGQVLVSNNLQGFWQISEYTAVCAKNECTLNCEGYVPGSDNCPPESASVPVVDFDSDDPNSFKSRAQAAQDAGQCQIICHKAGDTPYICSNNCILTSTEFENILWDIGQNGTATLESDITYITGGVELKGGRRLVVNGTLVADDNVTIGERLTWKKGSITTSGFSQITVDQPTVTTPSGILTKRKISFGIYSSFQDINIEGVLYANDEMTIISLPNSFNLVGGMIGRKITLSSLWQSFNITYDNDKILYGLGYKINGTAVTPSYSPIVTVEHWEESY